MPCAYRQGGHRAFSQARTLHRFPLAKARLSKLRHVFFHGMERTACATGLEPSANPLRFWAACSMPVALPPVCAGNLRRGVQKCSLRGAHPTRLPLQAQSQPRTWSNPGGLTLKQLQPNLFVAERPFIWNSIDVGGKMAVVKLNDGSLWVHSPVHLDPFLKRELAALGEVKHMVVCRPPACVWSICACRHQCSAHTCSIVGRAR